MRGPRSDRRTRAERCDGLDELTAAAEAFGHRLSIVDTLRGSERSTVVRALVDDGPDTVIVKAHDPRYADHWRRESAALAELNGRGLPVPELLAAAETPLLVVLADAGAGPNLADALLGDDPAAATGSLHAWADALATLHGATAAARATADPMPDLLAGAASMLTETLPTLGVRPAGPALAELASTVFETNAIALTPADACPDNNVMTASGLVLLDFEQACVRHVAWDAAYLLVPWPSCWCSWGLPAEVAAAALNRWRSTVDIPAVRTGAFDRDLDVAVAAWAVMSSAWFLAGALKEEHETPGGAGLPGPTRRAVIRHRMRLAARRRAAAPALAALAADVLAAVEPRWAGHDLRVAPAYR